MEARTGSDQSAALAARPFGRSLAPGAGVWRKWEEEWARVACDGKALAELVVHALFSDQCAAPAKLAKALLKLAVDHPKALAAALQSNPALSLAVGLQVLGSLGMGAAADALCSALLSQPGGPKRCDASASPEPTVALSALQPAGVVEAAAFLGVAEAMGEADVFAQKCPGFLDAACDAGLGGAACDAPPMLPSPSPLPECFPHCFTEGQPCERTTQCAAGLACVGGACTAGSVEGQSCQASAQCISGLECIGGVCATGGTEAQKCERASECVSGLSCVAGICTAGGFEKGQTCKASAQCVSGLACVDGVCADSESGREGQPCEQPSECVSGLQCTAGVCTPGRLPGETGDVGQSCEASAQCEAGLACVEGKCAAGGSRAEGEKCAESAQCASRLCVDGACASNGPGSSPSAEDNSTGGGGARKDSSWPCEGGACGYGSVNKTHASTTNPLREGADFRPKVQVPVYDGAQLYDSPPPSKPPSPPPPPPPGALGFGSVNKSVFGPTNPLRKLTQVPHYPGGAQQQQQGGLDVASNECDLAFWLCGRRPADYRVGGAHDVSGNSLDAHRHDDASRTDVAVAPLKGNVSVPAHNVPFSSASNASSTLADGTPIAGLEWLVVVFVVALIGCCVAWLWSSMAAKRRDS
jgi:hypothetical protein